MYTETVLDHFSNPRNVGKMPGSDGTGTAGDIICGDHVVMYIRVADGRIQDIRFMVFGCTASIATSSITTELVKGKRLEEALMLTEDDVANALGGLPDEKQHCSNLGVSALRAAIQDYESKQELSLISRIIRRSHRMMAESKEKVVHHMMLRLHGK